MTGRKRETTGRNKLQTPGLRKRKERKKKMNEVRVFFKAQISHSSLPLLYPPNPEPRYSGKVERKDSLFEVRQSPLAFETGSVALFRVERTS